MERPTDRPLGEALFVFAVVTAATAAITWLPQVLPGLDGYPHLVVGGIFLLTAVKLSQRERGGMRRYGVDLAGLLTPPDPDDPRLAGPLGVYDLARAIRGALPAGLREAGVAVGVAALIFPPFVLGFWIFHQVALNPATFELTWHPLRDFRFVVPDELGSFALTQLLVVALPEEAFFRGYLQTRLADRWSGRSVLGVALDPRVWLLQAACFSVIHFAAIPDPQRLAVFFPGLLFGLLRAWRGGIGAAMLLHAMSNVLAEILETGWLR